MGNCSKVTCATCPAKVKKCYTTDGKCPNCIRKERDAANKSNIVQRRTN